MLPLFGSDPIRVTHGPTEAERAAARRTVEPVHATSPTERIRARRRRERPSRPSVWEGLTFEEHLERARQAHPAALQEERVPDEDIPGDPFLGRNLDVSG